MLHGLQPSSSFLMIYTVLLGEEERMVYLIMVKHFPKHYLPPVTLPLQEKRWWSLLALSRQVKPGKSVLNRFRVYDALTFKLQPAKKKLHHVTSVISDTWSTLTLILKR